MLGELFLALVLGGVALVAGVREIIDAGQSGPGAFILVVVGGLIITVAGSVAAKERDASSDRFIGIEDAMP